MVNCPKCGSNDVDHATIGLPNAMQCLDCGYLFPQVMSLFPTLKKTEVLMEKVIIDDDDDHVTCPHCGEITHIGGLIGKHTDDCPRCGKQVLGMWPFPTSLRPKKLNDQLPQRYNPANDEPSPL